MSLSDKDKMGCGVYKEEDVKKHTQEFIEKLKESLMINQEEKTDIIDEFNKEMFDKIDKLAEEEFGDTILKKMEKKE